MGKSLHEGAIDPVVGHPLEVADHGFAVVGAEGPGRGAVLMEECRGVKLVVVVFGHIRPEVNSDISRPKHLMTVPGPVGPAETRSIAFAVEPALIAGHHLAGQRGRVYAGNGGAIIGLQYILLRFCRRGLQENGVDKR